VERQILQAGHRTLVVVTATNRPPDHRQTIKEFPNDDLHDGPTGGDQQWPQR
jgi:hypothetical protein